MNIRNFLFAIIFGLTLGTEWNQARGEPITWGFAGEVTFINDPGGFYGGVIGLGDALEGTYTFESSTPDSWPDTDRRGVYSDAVTMVTGHLGGVPFTGDGTPTSVIVINDGFVTPQIDSYAMSALIDVLGEAMQFEPFLYKNDGSFLSSDALLTLPPELEGLTEKKVAILREGGPLIRAELTNLWFVPEPGTLVMLTIGAAVVARRRRGILQE